MNELVDGLTKLGGVIATAVGVAMWISSHLRKLGEQATATSQSMEAARDSIKTVDTKLDRYAERLGVAEQRIAVLEDRARRAA